MPEYGGRKLFISNHPGLINILTNQVKRDFEDFYKDRPDNGYTVGRYVVTISVFLGDGKGVAMGDNPYAPSPFATWRFTEEAVGKREHFWGNYTSSLTSAKLDLYKRTFDLIKDGLELANPLAFTEMSAEQNYNMIDGIPNNEKPREDKPSVMEQIKPNMSVSAWLLCGCAGGNFCCAARGGAGYIGVPGRPIGGVGYGGAGLCNQSLWSPKNGGLAGIRA